MNTSNRDDVKQLASDISKLAQDVQTKVDNGEDILEVANELARKNLTFVFTLGEVYGTEQAAKTTVKKVKANVSATIVSGPRNYHNVRDSFGKFTKRV